MIKISIAKRPKYINFFYKNVSFKLGEASDYIVNSPNAKRYGLWQLVLDSKHIPYFLERHKDKIKIFVSPLFFQRARTELVEFSQEKDKSSVISSEIVHKHSVYVLFFLFFLYLFYLVESGQSIFSEYFTYDFNKLSQNGRIDAFKVINEYQFYRLITAQFLHSSYEHILSNILYSSIFLILLARRLPYNFTLLACVLSGAMANLCNVIYKYPNHLSVGFSVTLFAAIGMLSSNILLRDFSKKKIFLSIAVALAFLAFLGAGEKPIDYSAHSFGLICGFLFGIVSIRFIDFCIIKYKKANFFAGLILFLLIILAFSYVA